jgi:hypothetical protein
MYGFAFVCIHILYITDFSLFFQTQTSLCRRKLLIEWLEPVCKARSVTEGRDCDTVREPLFKEEVLLLD